jgi:hypothetical protein
MNSFIVKADLSKEDALNAISCCAERLTDVALHLIDTSGEEEVVEDGKTFTFSQIPCVQRESLLHGMVKDIESIRMLSAHILRGEA